MQNNRYAGILTILDEMIRAHVLLGLPPERQEIAEYRKVVERIEAIMIEKATDVSRETSNS